MTTTTDTARDQAKAQLDHIIELLEWLDHANECDDRDDCQWANDATRDYASDNLEAHDSERTTEAIHENALSVEVNYGWHSPFRQGEEPKPEQFRILLCTGGPAVCIMGELDEHGEPTRAWLEYQDWGTPWAEYVTMPPLIINRGDIATHQISQANALLRYASTFYFGG